MLNRNDLLHLVYNSTCETIISWSFLFGLGPQKATELKKDKTVVRKENRSLDWRNLDP